MKYKIEDIPFLVGCHFRLNFECLPSEDVDYLIAKYEWREVYVNWKGGREVRYDEHEFLDVLNENRWQIIDLPVIDFDSICVD